MEEEQKLPDLPDIELEELYSIIKFQLFKLVHLAATVALSLFFIILFEFVDSPILLSIIPLLILDVITISRIFRREPSLLLPQDVLSDSIGSLGSLVFLVLQLVFWTTQQFSFTYTLIPLFLGLTIRLFMKTKHRFECHSFSGIIFFMLRWVKAITLLSIGLKVDELIDSSWVGTLWLVWVFLCFIALLSLGALILLMSTCCSYLTEESKLGDIIGSTWFFYIVCGGFVSFSYFLLAFSQGDALLVPSVVVFCFLVLMISSTLIFNKTLVEWWSYFFITEEESMNEQGNERTVLSSRSAQVMNALKRPPKLLVRLSSAYFKPAKMQDVTTDKRRHLSDPNQKTIEEEEISDHTTHRRYHSSSLQPITSPKSNSLCTMCCENLADAVIMDCGHGGICYECSLEIWKATSQCHMCRMNISQVLQVEPQETQFFKVVSTTRALYKNEGQ